MSQSKASREKQRRQRLHKNQKQTRESVLPGKVAKEQRKFDFQYWMLKQQVEKSFPDPTDRLAYINSLLTALNEQSREIKVVETEPNQVNMPKEATSGYAVVDETVGFGEVSQNVPTQTHDGHCSCGCHEEG